MRFAEIEGAAANSIEGFVHQLAWPLAQLSKTPTSFSNVLFLGNEGHYCEEIVNICREFGLKQGLCPAWRI